MAPTGSSRWRRWALRALGALGAVVVACGAAGYALLHGGETLGPGTVHPRPLPPAMVHARAAAQAAAQERLGGGPPGKQILFGDLHVHTTFSGDAFLRSLPMLQGEGAHPPADACDFARFCSQLDVFALTDHAETITPARWAEERETVRRCNAVAGGGRDPDLVVFTGWEWTQVGLSPKTHYGHKNVIFRDVEDDKLPSRVIAATGPLGAAIRRSPLDRTTSLYPLQDFANRQAYLDFVRFQRETAAVPVCPAGVDERALPADCREEVATPRELFDKLGQWGFDALVIPHGTTWGFYTPVGSDWKKQLTGPQRDPSRQFLMEVYSGHGNSEPYRAWDGVAHDAQGAAVCPEPTSDYEPCCWRAGEIIRARCGDAPKEECERRVREARANHLAAGSAAHLTVPGASVEDWRDCGQCRDCFLPAYNYRPGGSAQLVLATTDFEDPAHPKNQTWGFLASSDNHSARPGTGYKEYGRRMMTETAGARDETWRHRLIPERAKDPESVKVDPAHPMVQPFLAVDVERQASFFLTGGLVAVHAEGRDRAAIWDALKRREVYGTSGERILLWFDLVDGAASHPMGSEVSQSEAPLFVVRAAGAFEQLPGCVPTPDGPPAERLERLCRGECNRPGERRKRITRIEVVRIRPQRSPGEPIASLIADPWLILPCPIADGTCTVPFRDPDFVESRRDATYYVRAIEEPSPAVNGGGLRCEKDASGKCVKPHPCYGDYRTPMSDDCLAPVEERAWSSPIFVRWEGR
jgi:hypothetical protein